MNIADRIRMGKQIKIAFCVCSVTAIGILLTANVLSQTKALSPGAEVDRRANQTKLADAPESVPALIVKDWKLFVTVKNESLGDVIDEIALQSGLKIEGTAALGQHRVSIDLKGMALDEGLHQLLRDFDTFFFYGAGSTPLASLKAVWIYPAREGADVTPVSADEQASLQKLHGELLNRDAEVRAEALEGLVDFGGPEAVAATLEALRDVDEYVRTRALDLVIGHGFQIPNADLKALALTDPSPALRSQALQALSNHPDARTMAELARSDQSPIVQEMANNILRSLEAQDASPTANGTGGANSPGP